MALSNLAQVSVSNGKGGLVVPNRKKRGGGTEALPVGNGTL